VKVNSKKTERTKKDAIIRLWEKGPFIPLPLSWKTFRGEKDQEITSGTHR